MKKLPGNIIAVLSILVLGWLFWYFSEIVTYIIISWILSLIGYPIAKLLQRIRIGRFRVTSSFSAALTIITFIIIIIAFFALLVPPILQQARNIAEVDYIAIAQSLEEPITHFQEQLIEWDVLTEASADPYELLKDQLLQTFSPNQLTNVFSSLIGFTGNLFIALFAVVFITFFFLKEKELFKTSIVAASPTKYEIKIRNVLESVAQLLTRYLGGILIQMTVITIFVTLGLTILGIPNALLIGFFAALINLVPYIGPILGATFGTFMAISSNLDAEFYTEMLPMIGKVLAVFASMQLLDNLILQPYIFSNSVMAHPLEIFIIILVGAKLGGILGMVLAIPAYTVVRIVASVFLNEFKVVKNLTKRIKDYESKRHKSPDS